MDRTGGCCCCCCCCCCWLCVARLNNGIQFNIKSEVSFGGIRGGAPRGPYARCDGMTDVPLRPPSCQVPTAPNLNHIARPNFEASAERVERRTGPR